MQGVNAQQENDAAIVDKDSLAARIAAFDWAATSLGPMEEWPQSLTTVVNLMLPSPVAMVLLWGEEGIMIYNDAYAIFAGGRDSRLLGSPVREGWGEVADFNDNVMKVGLAGGTLSYKDHQLTLYRDGSPERVWMNLDYSPVIGENGRPAGVIAIVTETTDAHHAKTSLEQSEGKFRFLDDLAQAVAGISDADEILAITTRMTADHLDISNCAYADMDADENGFTIRGDWAAPGSPSIVGRYVLSDFGTLAVQELGAGRPLIVNNNLEELLPEEAKTFRDIGIAATICMPLIKDGRLTALMAIHDKAPRIWSRYELGIIRDVTERSWAHVQRVGAEQQLRDREAHNRQILDSAIDYAIIATDLHGRVERWNAGATAILGWTEQDMLGEQIDRFFTPEDRAGKLPQEERDEALAHGRSRSRRWHVRKSGERFWASGEKTPLLDSSGTPIGLVKVLRDQTEEHIAQEALRTSEAQLTRAQAAGGVGLFSIDIVTGAVMATPEFSRIFGLSETGSIPATLIESLVIPGDEEIISDDESRRNGTAELDVEYRIRRADTGEERIIARKGEYERDEAGAPVRLVGAVQDVTDKRLTQSALQRSEARFTALAQSMPIQVWTARVDGYLDWFNARVYAYSGLNPGDLDGERWTRIVHPEDLPFAFEQWLSALATGTTYEVEMRLLEAGGEYRWHLARALPLLNADGEIASWVGTNTDIHAQKLAEAANARDRDRLWTMSRDLMLVCDFKGVITAVNPSAERLLGWSEEDMIGVNLADFTHPDDLASVVGEVAKLRTSVPTLAFESRYREKVGGYRLMAWTAVPDAGRIHAVGRDITEQRAVEEALRQSQKMEAVGQLTGGIAHDFNNLLQGITGSLDLLKIRIDQGRTDGMERFLTGAMSSANRAAALTHRLLAFSRRQPLDPRPVRANPLLSSMEDMLRRTLGERIEMEFVLDSALWLTRCDPNQLESAILNLAINARDAMPDGGKLVIETCNADLDSPQASEQREVEPGEYICICVTDTGTGMTKDTIAKAFEPFFTTKPIGQGTGLGLSMIYGFTRQSEGYVRIHSEMGEGSTIKLFLPRYRGERVEEETPASSGSAPSSEVGETVLVIEDEPVVRGLIVEVLGDLGYHAIEATDGPSGLAVLQSKQRIDLLITDIGLPGLNGRQVTDAARLSRPDLKVLFMTGYAENASLASGFLEEGMAMITKPFAIDVLATKIREIIEDY
ncbi:hybrid sensor histidine kinase/response regulator [Sphingobium sp. SCG-1]|uniref:PAS domain S-box protein n=1 Tax=Sphingobium sp. SCG-1 TaxID=2072936 RepID=UPI000CD6C23E|nr:PAS domain S-box protein [Sphingobium sp. SCG-1]AUW60250.1 hybrid sensor histidine kinase/response regulator [Sphingobium sp. SCG-1]